MTQFKLIKSEEKNTDVSYQKPMVRNNEFENLGVLRGGFPSESFRFDPEELEKLTIKDENSEKFEDRKTQAA